ncbi:lambda-exonuclease family protein [Pseudomonadota bacterium]
MSQPPVKMELEQGTPEWFRYRRRHFNASEAAAVVGCSPWMTSSQLLTLKISAGRRETNEAMVHGHRFEPDARALARQLFNAPDLEPAVCRRGRYSASLDAITPDLRLNVEIKCPVRGSQSDLWRKVSRGKLPTHYKMQLAHQWYVCGSAQNLLMVYCANEHRAVQVELSTEELGQLWADVVEPAWQKFAGEMRLAAENAPDTMAHQRQY